MNSIALILDVAHGKDVAGKRSPDGKFEEWKWSRDICGELYRSFSINNNLFDTYCPFIHSINEPGLKVRVKNYEELANGYKRTIMLSLHVDAFGKGSDWYNNITGFSFITSRGDTPADLLATFIGECFESKYLRDEKMRFANWLAPGETTRDLDWENNFTILMSRKYDGIIIENLFQTNRSDVYNKLLNNRWNNDLIMLYQSTIYDMMKEIKEGKL